MSNHLKLKSLGVGSDGLNVWLIKTLKGHYGIRHGEREVLFRTLRDAEGYGAHCVDPDGAQAEDFWKSRGLLPN